MNRKEDEFQSIKSKKGELLTMQDGKAKEMLSIQSRKQIEQIHKQGEQVNIKQLTPSKVIRLLEDPYRNVTKERQISAVKKLIRKSHHGLLLRELPEIFKIVNMCAIKAPEHPEFAPVICEVLMTCRVPFLKEKSSDEVIYADVVKDCIAQLGCLMRVPNTEVRLLICIVIDSFFNPVLAESYPEDVCPIGAAFAQQMVEQSRVAETMLLSLALLEKEVEVKLQVIKVLRVLCESSDINTDLVLKAQGAAHICLHMHEPDRTGKLVLYSMELLWKLLESSCKEEVSSQLSKLECIISLKEAFVHQLLSGLRYCDRQLRNDLLVITYLVAENPAAPFIESGFAKMLILIATLPEINSQNPLIRNLKLTFSEEDYEMKKLLFNILVLMSKDLNSLQLFKEARVLLALFHHVHPIQERKKYDWSLEQKEALQLQALATLTFVAPLLTDDYLNCRGNTRILLLMEWCIKKEEKPELEKPGEEKAEQESNYHENKAVMHSCLRLLRTMTAVENETVNKDLCDQGGIQQLLGIMKEVERISEDNDEMSQAIKSDIQLIISVLCEKNSHRKELFGAEGIDMTIHFLQTTNGKFYSGLGHNRLLLTTVDCVWSCIAGCYTTEDLFLEKGGLFLLMDLIESSPRAILGLLLGTLLELCDNPNTMSKLCNWKGGKCETVAGLLIHIWREEETDLGVVRDQYGRIKDFKKPILPIYQEQEKLDLPLAANKPSASIKDVMENIRSKIYCIFCKLGFENLSGLSSEDAITLEIIKKYLDFKVGEVWDEVSGELEAEGMRPVTPDGEALETINRLTEEKAREVARLQNKLIKKHEVKHLEEEHHLYAEIRSCFRQQQLMAESWKNYVGRTSDHKKLREAKKLQDECIEASRSRIEQEETNFHPTQISGLNLTTFCGRTVTMETVPPCFTGGPLANTEYALERLPIQGGTPQKLPIKPRVQQ